MNIGRTTQRIANWIVIGIAAVNVAISITDGKVGLIPNIVIRTVCCLIVIELLWRFCRAVSNGNIEIEFSAGTPAHHDSRRDCNPVTGLPMIGATDSGGHYWGHSDHAH
jgi:hypothetical protein